MEREQSELNHAEVMDFSEHITLSREEVIDEIINKDLGYYGSIEWLEKILKDGFAGYKKLSNEELTEEFVNYFPDHILTIAEELEGGE